MLNTVTTVGSPLDASALGPAGTRATQKVMIVDGCFGILESMETVLESGHYDVVFVESNERAYSQIKRVQPDLVILCVRIESLDGFHVLSMLKLDEETKDIPVLTYATAYDSPESSEESYEEPYETEMFTPRSAEVMN